MDLKDVLKDLQEKYYQQKRALSKLKDLVRGEQQLSNDEMKKRVKLEDECKELIRRLDAEKKKRDEAQRDLLRKDKEIEALQV